MRFSLRKCLVSAILLCFLLGVFMGLHYGEHDQRPQDNPKIAQKPSGKSLFLQKLNIHPRKIKDELPARPGKMDNKPQTVHLKKPTRGPPALDHETLKRIKQNYKVKDLPTPSYQVHAFYYSWYGNPKLDGKYFHWDHRFLPHWNKRESEKWKTGSHQPPEDVASNFYPEIGPYSSKDPDAVARHMVHLRKAGVGVLSLSWYPPTMGDDEGKPTDVLVPMILDIADIYAIKVNFHIEPYKGRTPQNLRENVQYIIEEYGGHPAFYRYKRKGRFFPMFFIYDSYLISPEDWATILKPEGRDTVRGTDIDALFIGLLVDRQHDHDIVAAGFDGLYTYFASNKFTFGSSWDNWSRLATYASARNLLFIPSVGPGYVDTEVRPWNAVNTKPRERGRYYESSFVAAIRVKPPLITITSFNEWHEGTQIEPAVIKKRGEDDYLNYSPGTSEYYLELTHKFIKRFHQHRF